MTSMWRPRYFAVVSRHEKVPTAPHMSAMPMSRARRALAASRASRADSVFMDVAAYVGIFSVWRGLRSNGGARQEPGVRARRDGLAPALGRPRFRLTGSEPRGWLGGQKIVGRAVQASWRGR